MDNITGQFSGVYIELISHGCPCKRSLSAGDWHISSCNSFEGSTLAVSFGKSICFIHGDCYPPSAKWSETHAHRKYVQAILK